MTVAVDSAALMYAYLKSPSPLISEITVGGKLQLYGPPGLPDQWTLSKSVVFIRQSGQSSVDLPLDYPTFQFRCYGTKPWDAMAVYLKLKPLLHRRGAVPVAVPGGQGLLQFARLISGPDDMIEPEVNWPFVLALFEVHIGEQTL